MEQWNRKRLRVYVHVRTCAPARPPAHEETENEKLFHYYYYYY